MDRLIYVAMSGAREAMNAQKIAAHNVANIGTTGFRALQHSMLSAPIPGTGFESRINAVSGPTVHDSRSGTMIHTGRDLDVAIQGDGWLTVQTADGEEAFTRAGNLRVNPNGLLETANGFLVMGNGGPISLPPYQKLDIGGDGQITIVPQGQKPNTIAQVDRLKLVNPQMTDLEQRTDTLFHLREGAEAPVDPNVRIATGQLESSNVNPAQMLVEMIEISRRYEMQVRAMNNADENDQAAARLMRMNG